MAKGLRNFFNQLKSKSAYISATMQFDHRHYKMDFCNGLLAYRNTQSPRDYRNAHPPEYYLEKSCSIDSERIEKCFGIIDRMISEGLLKSEELCCLPNGASCDAYMAVRLNNKKEYFYRNAIIEKSFMVKHLPVSALFLEFMQLIDPLCDFPELPSVGGREIRPKVFSDNVLKKVDVFREELLSDLSQQYTVYIYGATGIHGRVIYQGKEEVCRIQDGGYYPVSQVSISGFGYQWDSMFETDTTVETGMTRIIKDAVNGEDLYAIKYQEAGHYYIGDHLEVFCNENRYAYYYDGVLIARSREAESVDWVPEINGCGVRVSATVDVSEEISADVKLLVLSFPVLRFFF